MEESPLIYIDNVTDASKLVLISMLRNRFSRISKNLRIQETNDLGPARVKVGFSILVPEITKAIKISKITISIIDEEYLDRVEKYPELKGAIVEIQQSKNRYYFPIIYSKTNWLRAEWLEKSKLYPSNGSFSNKTIENQDEIINDLFIQIEIINQQLKGKNFSDGNIKPKMSFGGKKPIVEMNGDADVFISHANIDSDFAKLLCYELYFRGINSWLDKDKLKIGNNWQKEIDEGIEKSKAIIVVLSPESQSSQYVTYEWSYASGLRKKIFTIMLRQTQIHPKLDKLQYSDFTNFHNRDYDELVSAINKI